MSQNRSSGVEGESHALWATVAAGRLGAKPFLAAPDHKIEAYEQCNHVPLDKRRQG